MFDNIKNWILPDKADNALKSIVPLGFTGQGCLWYTNTAPAGWLICDGSLVDKAKYADLFILLGDTWGTSTSTQFYLPDLRTRVPTGKNSSGTFNTLNNKGGTETHTLTIAEMPSHTHTQNAHDHHIGTTVFDKTRNYSSFGTDSGVAASRQSGATVATNQNTGGGGSHNNLSPYIVVNFIIKA